MISCHNCQEELVFDNLVVSKNNKKIPLDSSTGEPHKCRSRTSNILECFQCGQEIQFNKLEVSKNGKMIPLNMDRSHHNCRQNQPVDCRACGEPIVFDPNMISWRGKLIPLDFLSKDKHQCTNNKSK